MRRRAGDGERVTTTTDRANAGPYMSISRLVFKSFWNAPIAIWQFHRLYRLAQAHPGFLRGCVALAGPRSVINISIWRSERDMKNWLLANPAHLDSVRWAHHRRREVWSAFWDLSSNSPSARHWDGEFPTSTGGQGEFDRRTPQSSDVRRDEGSLGVEAGQQTRAASTTSGS
jgi:hypothetical protein